jgi:hypothetical protein
MGQKDAEFSSSMTQGKKFIILGFRRRQSYGGQA